MWLSVVCASEKTTSGDITMASRLGEDKLYNREPVLQTRHMTSKRNMHLPYRDDLKHGQKACFCELNTKPNQFLLARYMQLSLYYFNSQENLFLDTHMVKYLMYKTR